MLNIAILDDEDIYMKRICKITEVCMRQMDNVPHIAELVYIQREKTC